MLKKRHGCRHRRRRRRRRRRHRHRRRRCVIFGVVLNSTTGDHF